MQYVSFKDHEHQRRIGKTCADIQLNESNEAQKKHQIFLFSQKNKSNHITDTISRGRLSGSPYQFW